MVLKLDISSEAEAALKSKAAAAGVELEQYASRLIEKMARQPRSLDELSGSIAHEFGKSGMTEDELAEFLETEKHAMRAEKRAKRSA
jgi:hypothetical protein